MYKKMVFAPGIVQTATQYFNEGRWHDGNLIRFHRGMPEKMGGWEKYSSNSFLGRARRLLNFISIAGANMLAVGSNKKFYVEVGGIFYDITPQRYENVGTLDSTTGISASDTTVVLSFAVSVNDYLRMGSDANQNGDELMIVSAVAVSGAAGENITVTRAELGTTASAHSYLDAVFHLKNISNPIGGVMNSSTVLIYQEEHSLTAGDFVTFLKIGSAFSRITGLTRADLFYDSTSGYDTSTSNQSFEVSRVLNANYYEISGPDTVTGIESTTLNGAVASSDTQITLTGGTWAPTDRVKINDEYMVLTSLSAGSTWNVDRGQFGSNRADHADGAAVSELDALDGGNCIILRDIRSSASTYSESSGWGAGAWGGIPSTTTQDQLNGAITDVATTIVVDDLSSFPTSGTILIDQELITYTGVTPTTDFDTGVVRGAFGTTASAHSDNVTVYSVDVYWTPWGGPTVSIPGESISSENWSIDNFGEDLVLAKDRGTPYYWNTSLKKSNGIPFTTTYDASATSYATGIVLADAVPMSSLGVSTDDGYGGVPDEVGFLMVSPFTRQVIAFGCEDTLGNYDPMLIRFCDIDRPGSWNSTDQNYAGGSPLQKGSVIKAAAPGRREIVIWTDSAMYSMEYIGGNLVYGFQEISDSVSIASQYAYTTGSNIIFWMGDRGFFAYDGAVQQLDCSVLDEVFENFNYEGNREKATCGHNPLYNEIIWFYMTANATEVDKYVTYNYVNQTWAYGTMSRTSWSGSGLREKPQAASVSSEVEPGASVIMDHETGYQADGEQMDSFVESGFFDIDDGDYSMYIDRYIPDYRVIESGGSNRLLAEIEVKDYPSSTASNTALATVTPTTEFVNIRERGRTASIKITDLLSDGSNDQFGWELGSHRISVKPDGKR